jgi:phosphoribosylformimino-5-aminoimidazole carboxamide ribotide isomerase
MRAGGNRGVILYPAIDIRDGHAVRLLRGDYERETVYDADPADAARRWAADGARYVHVVDLDGAREGRPVNLEAVKSIASSVEVPLQVGGGLRDADAIAAVLEAGAERVVLGTAAMCDPELLRTVLRTHGERVVVSVDARGGRVALQGWTERGETDAPDAMAELTAEGVRRFVFTPIEVDGTMQGPGLEELRRVAGATEAELIYSGGVGELAHLRSLAAEAPANLAGVIVGRALYEERFSVADAQAVLDEAG